MIVANRVIYETGQTIGTLDTFVVFEIESWRMAQTESTTDFTAQEPCGTAQTLADFLRRMTIAERHEHHAGRAHIG